MKIRVGILFGGKSAEHEVSLQSAKNVISAINKDKYETVLIGVDRTGQWRLNSGQKLLAQGKSITLDESTKKVDVIFPILHGPFGEDGTVQGLLKLANIPFVGASVLGSAVGMDKDVMKRLLRDANIPIGRFMVFNNESFKDIVEKLGIPLFVKPANLGSSVGVSKVNNEEEFKKAIELAFEYDNKVIIEEFIKGRELECSVLGNKNPKASVVGEVLPNHEFYSYEAKYIDENGAVIKIPADISSKVSEKVRELAVKTFKVLECEGMGRVDFFLKNNNDVIVNEINTIPGFTSISMYPKLWEASGVSYSDLIDKLIQLAIGRFEKEQRIKTSY